MTRGDRLTLVRQLREEGLSQRAIAKRLKVSKDTVRRDLERLAAEGEPDDASPDETDDPAAPQVSAPVPEGSAPGDAPQGAPVAQLLTAVADPPGEPGETGGRQVRHLVVDLAQFPGLAEDLALLQETGASAVEVVSFAVEKVAAAYRTARERGLLQRGQSFAITDMRLRSRAA